MVPSSSVTSHLPSEVTPQARHRYFPSRPVPPESLCHRRETNLRLAQQCGLDSRRNLVSANTEHRKLAAIMFTDLVGSSALAQRNEALTQTTSALQIRQKWSA